MHLCETINLYFSQYLPILWRLRFISGTFTVQSDIFGMIVLWILDRDTSAFWIMISIRCPKGLYGLLPLLEEAFVFFDRMQYCMRDWRSMILVLYNIVMSVRPIQVLVEARSFSLTNLLQEMFQTWKSRTIRAAWVKNSQTSSPYWLVYEVQPGSNQCSVYLEQPLLVHSLRKSVGHEMPCPTAPCSKILQVWHERQFLVENYSQVPALAHHFDLRLFELQSWTTSHYKSERILLQLSKIQNRLSSSIHWSYICIAADGICILYSSKVIYVQRSIHTLNEFIAILFTSRLSTVTDNTLFSVSFLLGSWIGHNRKVVFERKFLWIQVPYPSFRSHTDLPRYHTSRQFLESEKTEVTHPFPIKASPTKLPKRIR